MTDLIERAKAALMIAAGGAGMSKAYMGQIMAECDCQHPACEVRGYCMAERIEALESENARLRAFVTGYAMRALFSEHERDEQFLLDHDTLLFQRDCDIVEARALASDPAAVAQIIEEAKKERG